MADTWLEDIALFLAPLAGAAALVLALGTPWPTAVEDCLARVLLEAGRAVAPLLPAVPPAPTGGSLVELARWLGQLLHS